MRVFSLRIDDNDVRIRRQHQIHYLIFSHKRFASTGYTQDECIAVEEPPSVGNYHVLGNDIVAIVDAMTVIDLLNTKRHEYCK